MNGDTSDWAWLNDWEVCSAQYLAEVSGLSQADIDELVEMGVIVPVNAPMNGPIDAPTQPQSFYLRCVVTVKTARRLRDDFDLDRNGMVLAVTLMQRIDALNEELDALRARIVHAP